MLRRAFFFLVLTALPSWGQSPDAFEVASIKPAAPQGADGRYFSGCKGGPGTTDPGRITCTNMSPGPLIAGAYGIDVKRISGLKPPYAAYDIIAKLPDGATREQVPRMWQTLLADRFKLAVHREKKDTAVYRLVVAKGGAKLKESPDDPAGDASPVGPPGRVTFDKEGFPIVAPGGEMTEYKGTTAHFAASKAPMVHFVSWLENRLRQEMQSDRPVVDATGLLAKYDIKLTWAPSGMGRAAADPPDGPSLLEALQNQLGLKIEQAQAQIEILVVDRIEKSPVEN